MCETETNFYVETPRKFYLAFAFIAAVGKLF